MDFDAIQVTLGVMAQAIIAGRIDCKTAGRLAVGLQTAVKLLRLHHRVHRGTQRKQTNTIDGKEHQDAPEVRQVRKHGSENDREVRLERDKTVEITLIRSVGGLLDPAIAGIAGTYTRRYEPDTRIFKRTKRCA